MTKNVFDQGAWSQTAIAKLMQKAAFLESAAKAKQYPLDHGVEVAFVGRSNVGKSTCINTLTQQRRLAHSSKTPGRTQLINFFKISDYQRLVDLPGYGYAQVAVSVKKSWAANIEEYFSKRDSLVGLIWLVDSRRDLADQDIVLVNWLVQHSIPTQILVAKADKLSKNQAMQSMASIKRCLNDAVEDASHLDKGLWSLLNIQLFSATNKIGIPQVSERMINWLVEHERSYPLPEEILPKNEASSTQPN